MQLKATENALGHEMQVESMAMFSSISSTFGNMGQFNYAASNAYLDASILSHRLRGVSAFGTWLSLQVSLRALQLC